MKKEYMLLLMVVIFGLGVRLLFLDSLPSILNRDEAALAYNAVLLKEKGVDEWGRSWPIALESFGDYKLIGYPLLLIPAYSVFGYHDWVVRLPAVMAGVMLIVIAYAWSGLFQVERWQKVVFSLLVATAPVYIFYSRMAFEALVGLSFLLGGLWFLLTQKKPTLQGMGILCIMMATITYNTPFLLLPLLLPLVVIRHGWSKWRVWAIPVMALGLWWLILNSVLTPLMQQKSSITVFADPLIREEQIAYYRQFSGLEQKLIGNKFVFYAQLVIVRLTATFSPQFLVTNGGQHPWHSLPDWGHLYWITYGLGLLGICSLMLALASSLLKNLRRDKTGSVRFSLKQLEIFFSTTHEWLLMSLLILFLLPAVVTVDAPHATRSLGFFFFFLLAAVKGWQLIRSYSPRLVDLLAVSILLVELSYFCFQLFAKYPKQQILFMPGYDVLIQEVERNYPNDKIAVEDKEGYHYILTAWYLKMPPDVFLNTIHRQLPDRIGFKYGDYVSRYHFIFKEADRKDETVFVEWNDKELRWEVKE